MVRKPDNLPGIGNAAAMKPRIEHDVNADRGLMLTGGIGQLIQQVFCVNGNA